MKENLENAKRLTTIRWMTQDEKLYYKDRKKRTDIVNRISKNIGH